MKIDQDPEYKSKYLDYSRDRPVYRKPPPMMRPTVTASSPSRGGGGCFFGGAPPFHHHRECRAFEYEPTSEVRSQYVSYGHVPRAETLRMPTSLRQEGNIDLLPEYRSAYCARYDRHHRDCDEFRTHSRTNRSPSASKRSKNYWLNDNDNNNNNDNYRYEKPLAVAQGQDAFHVLDTRIHEENVTGKPPPASRKYV